MFNGILVVDFTKVNASRDRSGNRRSWKSWQPATRKLIRTGFAVQRNNVFRSAGILICIAMIEGGSICALGEGHFPLFEAWTPAAPLKLMCIGWHILELPLAMIPGTF